MFVSPARPATFSTASPQGQPSSMVTPMKDHNIDISRKKAQPVSINNCNIVLNRPEASSPPMKQIFQSLLHKESYCPKIYPIRSFVPVEIENNPLFPYLQSKFYSTFSSPHSAIPRNIMSVILFPPFIPPVDLDFHHSSASLVAILIDMVQPIRISPGSPNSLSSTWI